MSRAIVFGLATVGAVLAFVLIMNSTGSWPKRAPDKTIAEACNAQFGIGNPAAAALEQNCESDLLTRDVANRLDGADFRGANLTRAVLGPVDHAWGEERYAQRSVMIGCDFSGARMVEANLVNGVFLFAKFRDADLTVAEFEACSDYRWSDIAQLNATVEPTITGMVLGAT